MNNKIGRRIYYEKATGNVIWVIGERSGSVVPTTVDQDFESFVVLAQRVRDTVDMIDLPYGQDTDKFGKYAYYVDPSTTLIVWDLTPPQIEEAERQLSLEEKVAVLEKSLAKVTKIANNAVNMTMQLNGMLQEQGTII